LNPRLQVPPKMALFPQHHVDAFEVYFNWDSRAIREALRCRDANC
jgi:hypothetical protein